MAAAAKGVVTVATATTGVMAVGVVTTGVVLHWRHQQVQCCIGSNNKCIVTLETTTGVAVVATTGVATACVATVATTGVLLLWTQ